MDDSELIRRLREREQDAAAALMKKYGALIRYIAGGILSDPCETEECVSDVCLSVWQNIGKYSPAAASFRTWLTAVARNTALNRAKAAARHTSVGADDDIPSNSTPETELLRRERAAALKKAVSALGEHEKELFYRKYYYLQSTEKIASEMGLTRRAVEGRLYRLRAKLRGALGGDAE